MSFSKEQLEILHNAVENELKRASEQSKLAKQLKELRAEIAKELAAREGRNG